MLKVRVLLAYLVFETRMEDGFDGTSAMKLISFSVNPMFYSIPERFLVSLSFATSDILAFYCGLKWLKMEFFFSILTSLVVARYGLIKHDIVCMQNQNELDNKKRCNTEHIWFNWRWKCVYHLNEKNIFFSGFSNDQFVSCARTFFETRMLFKPRLKIIILHVPMRVVTQFHLCSSLWIWVKLICTYFSSISDTIMSS